MADSEEEVLLQDERPPDEVQDTSSRGSSLVHHRTEVSYSGPLPPPGVIGEYERILPGAADRIFTMAEKQIEHRMSLEKTVIEGGSKRAGLGIYAAVIVEGMFLATSCYLAHLGLTADALKVVGGSAVGLIATFGFGTLSRRNERVKKQEIQAKNEAED